jgi:hypothetical protein
MNKLKYRKLYIDEIRQLIDQGCYCRDWNFIEVIWDFTPEQLKNVHFYGYNRIGKFDEEITLFGGACLKTGIYNVHIKNCIVENNALIKNIPYVVSNCRIGERVVLHQINQEAEGDKSNRDCCPVIWLLSGFENLKMR